MAPRLKSKLLCVILAAALAGPAYWAGYHAAIFMLRRETPEYKVWQESYYVDRRFYDAISENPPPRYLPPRPWEGHLGGAAAAFAAAALTLGATLRRPPNPTLEEPEPSA
ncbi:MAG: hypothetical protein WBG37_08245 [Desulfobacterales bacterium]|jgi:hypothetical protein